MRLRWLAALALLLLAVQAAAAREAHAPIRIVRDADFLLPTSGVVGGSGTAEDPYVIAGWDIDAGLLQSLFGATGISVEGTSAYFVISDCGIQGAFQVSSVGIELREVSHAIVLGVDIGGVIGAVTLDSVSDVVVANLTYIGPGPLPADGPGEWIGTRGVQVTDSKDVQVTGGHITDAASGIGAASSQVSVVGTRFSRLQFGAVDVFASSDVSVVAVEVERAAAGVDASDETSRMQVLSSRFLDVDYAVGLSDAAGQVVEWNTFVGGREAIGGYRPKDPYIANNTFTGTAYGAIRLGDGQGARVVNNTFVGSGDGQSAVIEVYRQGAVTIHGNTIQDNPSSAIRLDSGTDGSRVERNTIHGNRGSGVSLGSNNNTVRYNRIVANGEAGVELWDVAGNVVRDNEIKDNDGGDIVWARRVQDRNDVSRNERVPTPQEMAARSGERSPGTGAPLLLMVVALAAVALRRRP